MEGAVSAYGKGEGAGSTHIPLGYTMGRSNEEAQPWQPGMSDGAMGETGIALFEFQGKGKTVGNTSMYTRKNELKVCRFC